MASSSQKGAPGPEYQQIDLMKLNFNQLSQLKNQLNSVGVFTTFPQPAHDIYWHVFLTKFSFKGVDVVSRFIEYTENC